MVEHERSYCFTHEGAHNFLQDHGMSVYCGDCDSDNTVTIIKDCYLGKGMRVRRFWTHETLPQNCVTVAKNGIAGYDELPRRNSTYVFTQKRGDKAKGYRFEFEEEISEQLAEALVVDKKLCIKKIRKKLPVGNDGYLVTMDFILEPMKIAILEVEAAGETTYPVPIDIVKKLFNTELIECPLCSFSLLTRHIAICGGPSSGKSETAKGLSHIINTRFQGNSFHVAEFATTFIQKYHKHPKFLDQFFVWHGQHEREHSAIAADIIISDCPTFLTYIYLMHFPKETFSDNTALIYAKVYKRVLFDVDWYSDILFLKLKNYKENNIRYQTPEQALDIERRLQGFLTDHNIQYSSWDYTQVEEIVNSLFYLNS